MIDLGLEGREIEIVGRLLDVVVHRDVLRMAVEDRDVLSQNACGDVGCGIREAVKRAGDSLQL